MKESDIVDMLRKALSRLKGQMRPYLSHPPAPWDTDAPEATVSFRFDAPVPFLDIVWSDKPGDIDSIQLYEFGKALSYACNRNASAILWNCVEFLEKAQASLPAFRLEEIRKSLDSVISDLKVKGSK